MTARRGTAGELLARVLAALAVAALGVVATAVLSAPFGGVRFFVPLAFIAAFSLVAGIGPAILSTVLTSFGVSFLLQPRGHLAVADRRDVHQLVFFAAVGAIVAVIGGAQRRAHRAQRSALDKRERDYRSLAESSPEIIARFDRQLRHTYLNDYGAKVYGVPPAAVLGRTNAELGMPSDKVAFWTERLEQVFATGRQQTVDFELESPNFGHQFFSAIFVPERDAHGQVASILSITRDVSDARRAEIERDRLTMQLRLAFDAAKLGWWHYDLVTGTATCDDGYRAIMGVAGDELPDERIWALIHPADLTRVREALRSAIDPGTPKASSIQTRIRRADTGEERWVEVHALATFGGEGTAPRASSLDGLVADITDRKLAEEGLRASETRFRSVFEQAAIGMGRVRFDDARWMDVNDVFCHMLGRSREEMLRTPWPEMTHPDDLDVDLVLFRRMADGELDSYTVEKRFIHKSGEYVWSRLTLSLVRDTNGRPDCEIAIIEDVSDRKRAEEALRHSEERLRAVLENMSEGLMLFDADGDLTYENPASLRIHGFGPQQDGTIERDELPATWNAWDMNGRSITFGEWPVSRAFRGERFQGQLLHVQRAETGQEFDASYNGSPIRDPAGKLVGAFVTIRDITDEARAERALKESEARFRDLADNIAQFAWMADEKGRISWYNQRWHEYTGTSLDQMQGWGWQKALHPNHTERVVEKMRHCLESGEAWEDTFPLRGKDGEYRWFLTRAIPIRDESGRVIRWFGTNTDVTDQRMAERRLQTIIETIPVALFILEPNGRATLVNDEAIHTWAGRGRLESLADYGEYKGFWPDTGKPLAPEDWPGAQSALDGRTMKGVIIDIERFDGSRGTIVVSCAPVRDENGHVVAAVVANQDITALRQAQARLQEADKRKNEFLAVLSHELRNPLMPIRNSLYVAERAVPGGEQSRRALTVIDRQVTQMARLIDDLLDVSRISRGKILLHRESLELNDIVRGAAEDHRALFADAGIDFQVAITAKPLRASIDKTRAAQVVGNLLHNAAKFTPSGGRVTLSVESDDEGHAIISVRDTGVGIEPRVLASLFQPFVQADATLDRSKGGLGLGLALVKGLVELHGGSVSARSGGPGLGAELRVALPLEERDVVAVQLQPGTHSNAPAKRLRVLLIEDNDDAAQSLKEALELNGHEVETAAEGGDGIEKARAFHPDVVLCDIGLPGMDGFEVARAMRSDPALRSACLVALSGYAAPEDVERAKQAGFAQHLAKPPSIDDLESTLSDACAS